MRLCAQNGHRRGRSCEAQSARTHSWHTKGTLCPTPSLRNRVNRVGARIRLCTALPAADRDRRCARQGTSKPVGISKDRCPFVYRKRHRCWQQGVCRVYGRRKYLRRGCCSRKIHGGCPECAHHPRWHLYSQLDKSTRRSSAADGSPGRIVLCAVQLINLVFYVHIKPPLCFKLQRLKGASFSFKEDALQVNFATLCTRLPLLLLCGGFEALVLFQAHPSTCIVFLGAGCRCRVLGVGFHEPFICTPSSFQCTTDGVFP